MRFDSVAPSRGTVAARGSLAPLSRSAPPRWWTGSLRRESLPEIFSDGLELGVVVQRFEIGICSHVRDDPSPAESKVRGAPQQVECLGPVACRDVIAGLRVQGPRTASRPLRLPRRSFGLLLPFGEEEGKRIGTARA